jgi:hypothetical protein
MKIRPVCSMRTNNDRDRTKLLSRFSQFCERAHKFTPFCRGNNLDHIVECSINLRTFRTAASVYKTDRRTQYSLQVQKKCCLRKQLFGMPKKQHTKTDTVWENLEFVGRQNNGTYRYHWVLRNTR